MNCVGTIYAAAAALCLCSPALAGNGNALAGGWNGELSGAGLHVGAPVPTGNGSGAPARQAAAPSSYSSGGSFFEFGSEGGSGQTSGGAPSPEVNAGLGLLLAGGTVAFLRRKRGRPASPAT